jgi:hypothetical protein
MRREKNKRPWGDYNMFESWVSGNYYPVTAMIGIHDSEDDSK